MKSIQSKFMVLILSMLALSSILIGGIGIYKSQKMIEIDTATLLELLCNEKATKIDNTFLSTKHTVDMIASNSLDELYHPNLIYHPLYRGAYTNEMKKFISMTLKYSDSAITGYLKFNPETTPPDAGIFLEKVGNDILEKLPIDTTKYNNHADNHVIWYHKPIDEKSAVWINPYINLNNGIYMISYVVPLFKDGLTIGVVGMDIDFDKIVDEILKIRIFQSGFAYLMSDDGKVVFHPYQVAGRQVPPRNDSIEISRRLTNGMYLVLTAPRSEINFEKNRLFAQIVFFTFLIAIIFIILTSEISKSIIRPLKSLTEAAQKISQGNLEFEIDSNSKDEIGTLARSLKKTVSSLKKYIDYINSLAYKDALTGVKNKASYDNAINQLESEIKSGKTTQYSIAVFDANGLKLINDTFGHEFGNSLIINSCKLICDVFSHSPIFRIGGDEFVAILKNADFENRKKLQNLLNERMKEMEKNKDICERVSIACGIADYNENEKTSDVFKRADKIMYENKKLMKMEAAVKFIL